MTAWPRISMVGALLLLFALPIGTHAAPRYKVLHSFGRSDDGNFPSGPPLQDATGNLYGVTGGGPGEYGYGTLYELMPQADGTWKEKVLHDFGSGDGYPWGVVVSDSTGNLYGTTEYGPDNNGEVFELSPAANDWAFGVLYTDIAGPGLLMDKRGNLYGEMGRGQYKYGAIGELSPASGGWDYTLLYSFCSTYCPDGFDLPAPPIWDGHGNLYGTTGAGGIGRPACLVSDGCGVIFKMTPNGDGTWTYHVLHRFASYANDGQGPFAGLVMDKAGNFYGSTSMGGRYGRGNGGYGNGMVFKLSYIGGRWNKTTLYEFPHCADGCAPLGPMAFDKAGNLYGAANGGLPDCTGYDCGVIFKLSPQPGGKWTYTVLHKLTAADGEYPRGVIIDGKGHLFGTTSGFGKYYAGTAFEVIP